MPDRSRATLLQQMCDVERYLASGFSDEEALSIGLAQPQYDIKPGRGSRAPQAGFTTRVHHRLSRLPLHLLCHVPEAWRALDRDTRAVLYLVVQCGQQEQQVALAYRRSERWVRRKRWAGLEALARQLWQDDGSIAYLR
jgi:hypothetical protein